MRCARVVGRPTLPGTEMARAHRSHSPPVTSSDDLEALGESESSETVEIGEPGRASTGLVHGKVLASTSSGARREPSGSPSTRS